MGEFKRGDRVKVEFEAKYAHESGRDYVMVEGVTNARVPRSALTLLEPEWRLGDIVKDEDGTVFVRCLDASHPCWHTGGLVADHDGERQPIGRLTRLVPES